MKQIKTIVAIGHLPQYAGGKQNSGLANVIWNICKNINVMNVGYRYELIATDVKRTVSTVDGVVVYGWTIPLLLSFSLKNLRWIIKAIMNAVQMKRQYHFPLFNTIAKLIVFSAILKQIKPDYLHIHGCLNFAIFSRLPYKIPSEIIITLHGINALDENIKEHLLLRKIEEELNAYPCMVLTFVSSQLERDWVLTYGQPKAPTFVVPNGYESNIFKFIDDLPEETESSTGELINLLTIGSITELKGQRKILEALSILVSQGKYFRYIIAGSGKPSYVEKLKRFAGEAGLDVQFLGPVDHKELPKIITSNDYMILCSSSEGFGLVFLESIACGTTVILPESLPIVKEGTILNEINSVKLKEITPTGIAECLLSLEKSRYSRSQVAETVKEFAWEHAIKQYTEIFNKF